MRRNRLPFFQAPRVDADDEERAVEPDRHPGEILAKIELEAERLAGAQVTRPRRIRGTPLGAMSKSRRDGFRPDASKHVERYLLHEVMGVSVRAMCWSSGLSRSTILESVRVGRELARASAHEAIRDDSHGRPSMGI